MKNNYYPNTDAQSNSFIDNNEANHTDLLMSQEEVLALKQELLLKQQDMENRSWLDSNLNKFDDILRTNYDNPTEIFADNIISYICKVTQAVQGAFYVVDKDLAIIDAQAGFACTLETMHRTSFRIGEGIIGQAVKSKQMMILDGLETRLDSSLGRVTSSSLVASPLIFNEEVYGVIELTHLKKPKQAVIDFIERACRNVASSLQSIINNQKTKRLLEESMQNAEEMRTQSEELRQNMEELQAIQEEVHRKELELRGAVEAINNTFASVEFDMNGIILQANDAFAKTMGYRLNEIIGQHHSLFVGEEVALSEEYKQFWQELSEGKSQVSSEFRRFAKNNREVWLSASYTPVQNTSGEYYKVIKLALDVTKQKKQALDIEVQMEAIHKSFAVIEFELDSTILTANQNFLATLGYELEEIVGKKHVMFVDAQHQQTAEYQNLWKNLRQGKFQEGAFPRITKSGRKIWISGSYNPIFDIDGKPYKVVKYVRDITAQRQQKDAYEQDLNAFQKANLVTYLDLEGKVLEVNTLVCETLGYQAEELRSVSYGNLLNAKEAFAKILQILETQEFASGEITYKHKTGKLLHLKTFVNLIYDFDKNPAKILVINYLV